MAARLEHMLRQPIQKRDGRPAHVQVQERVIQVIEEGLLEPGSRLPSEPELAEGLGVSRMTANKALLALVDQGWIARQKGRGTYVLARPTATTNFTLELIVGEDLATAIENYYFGALYFGVQSAAAEQRVPVHCRSLRSLIESQEELTSDGVIVINPPLSSLETLKRTLAKCKTKLILGANWPGSQIPCIDSDNILGAAQAVGHLADNGHRRILFVGACPEDSNTLDRVKGYDIACRLRSCQSVHPPLISPTALDLESEIEGRLTELLRSQDRPTGIFVAGATLALQVSRLVQQVGLSIPGDVSVVAYDDPAFLVTASPALDTLRQPLGTMGRTAFNHLVAALEGKSSPPLQTVLPPELILRGSVGPARDRNLFSENLP